MKALTIPLLTLALLPATAEAQTRKKREQPSYDGTWQVSLVVTEGRCQQIRYPAQIRGNKLVYEGFLPVKVEGVVRNGGQVTAVLSYGQQQATGKGKLNAKNRKGSGTWSAPPLKCQGFWTAELETPAE